MTKCPFEQMVRDAKRDSDRMLSLTKMRLEEGASRGVVMWIAASTGYNYSDTLTMLGADWIEHLWCKYHRPGPYRPVLKENTHVDQ